MYFCYVDESGGFEVPGTDVSATPLMVIVGVVVDVRHLREFTLDYLAAKKRFFPGRTASAGLLNHIKFEIKGAHLRAVLRSGSARERSHAIGYLDTMIAFLRTHHVRLVGRIWIKEPGIALKPDSSYSYAIQDIATHFERFLTHERQDGLVLCDSRMHNQNAVVSHSLFTQKMRRVGDAYPHIVESPVFGHSVNHAGLQLADLVASAFLFPMASRTYCASRWTGIHVHPAFDVIKTRYGTQCKAMEYRYQLGGQSRGGIVVSDRLLHRPSSALFI